MSLCLLLSLYCWIWLNKPLCSDLATKTLELYACSCSGAFDADIKQVRIAEIQISLCKSLAFHALINFQFQLETRSVHFVCHSREIFVFDSNLRVLYKKKRIWVKSKFKVKPKQLKFVLIVNYIYEEDFYLVQYCTKIESISYVWIVSYVCTITSRNICHIKKQCVLVTSVMYYIYLVYGGPSFCWCSSSQKCKGALQLRFYIMPGFSGNA